MSVLNISSDFSASSIVTLYIFLCSGSIVVSQSCSGFISQRPLYLCIFSHVIPSESIIACFSSSVYTYQDFFPFHNL